MLKGKWRPNCYKEKFLNIHSTSHEQERKPIQNLVKKISKWNKVSEKIGSTKGLAALHYITPIEKGANKLNLICFQIGLRM